MLNISCNIPKIGESEKERWDGSGVAVGSSMIVSVSVVHPRDGVDDWDRRLSSITRESIVRNIARPGKGQNKKNRSTVSTKCVSLSHHRRVKNSLSRTIPKLGTFVYIYIDRVLC